MEILQSWQFIILIWFDWFQRYLDRHRRLGSLGRDLFEFLDMEKIPRFSNCRFDGQGYVFLEYNFPLRHCLSSYQSRWEKIVQLHNVSVEIFFVRNLTVCFMNFSQRRKSKPEDEIALEVFVRNLAKASYVNFNSIPDYPELESKHYMSLLVNLSMNFNPGKKLNN